MKSNKPTASRSKSIIKIWAAINEVENRKTVKKTKPKAAV